MVTKDYTIDELYELIRENTISVLKMRKENEIMEKKFRRESEIRAKELNAILNKFATSSDETKQRHKETEQRNKETEQRHKEAEQRQKENEQRFKETYELQKKVFKQLGNIGANNGAVAEDFFFHGFTSTMQVDNIKYDYIDRNKKRFMNQLGGEYDIVLVNSNHLLIVEVKYNLHPKEVLKFYEKKLPKFKKLFPEYKNYKITGAVAALLIPEKSLEDALNYGLMVFTQSGEKIKNLTPDNMKLYEF